MAGYLSSALLQLQSRLILTADSFGGNLQSSDYFCGKTVCVSFSIILSMIMIMIMIMDSGHYHGCSSCSCYLLLVLLPLMEALVALLLPVLATITMLSKLLLLAGFRGFSIRALAAAGSDLIARVRHLPQQSRL